jgi:hypothetical protein
MESCGEKWMIPAGNDTVRYFHCTHCDLIFIDPELRQEDDRERERYLEHNNSPQDPRYVSYLRGFAEEALHPYVSPGASILDYGSGPVPVFAEVLRGLGFRVDIYDPFFATGREWEGRLYDGVSAVEVVEHFFDPSTEFRLLRRVIVSGGHLVLRTLLHHSDRERFVRWWYRQDPTHVCFYSERSFQVLADMLGMELFDIKEGRSVTLRPLC